jgi:transposase
MPGSGSAVGRALGAALSEEHGLTLLREGARREVRTALEIEGSQSSAADRLGVGRRTLVRWLAQWPALDPARGTIDKRPQKRPGH